MAPEPLPLDWPLRPVPLAPALAVARGASARRLLRRLRALPDAELGRLEGGVAPGLVVLRGGPAELPWVDGIAYLGREEAATGLFVPTTRQPSAPAALAEAALRARADLPAGPVAVLLDPLTVVPLGALRRLDRALVEEWER